MAPLLTPEQLDQLEINESHEYMRVEFWLTVSPKIRSFLVYMAGLPRERANDPLTSFTAQERARMAANCIYVQSNLNVAFKSLSDQYSQTTVLLH